MDHIFHSEICCFDKDQLEQKNNFGIANMQVDEVWHPIAMDLTTVVCIRKNGDDPERGPQVTLYTQCDSFTVLGEYKPVLERWIKARDTGFFKNA